MGLLSFQSDDVIPFSKKKSHGYHLQIAGLRWTSSRRSISLYPSENGMVRGEIDEKTAYIQARPLMARVMEVNGEECEAEGKARVV